MAHLKNDQALMSRVRRISGQLSAVERAIDGEADCASVLQQVAAVRGAVNGLMDEILESHLREHVAAPGLSDAARAQGAEELMAAIRRYAK
ncbi:metal/formaldehyde-sensitive transcriptional repressor [Caulobacter sp. RHG1]|uniref:metal/formaldehyde-sensitive transcriptional repressor n=1 Tax=Caulobacter sp. (strain RHG1) TaxID=2545762 RepID=UPI001557D2C4|nr:metal/formaldehyde-sensitive transcriptional repressor [Caulobacter sp. RHG1]NQE65097.1 hypothetical protein [Caulobacter sp. RHG1]